jgi:hypothetical protein
VAEDGWALHWTTERFWVSPAGGGGEPTATAPEAPPGCAIVLACEYLIIEAAPIPVRTEPHRQGQ